ncbi:hypothetical protein EG829_09350 [bacterium]|nr:hypothetical protein [bacterium]
MKRSSTPSFVLELPLVVKPGEERLLLARLECARRLYNAVLGEALRRQRLMREARAWQKARLLKDKKERAATFRKIGAGFAFTSASLSAFATNCKNVAGWQDRLGAHETQKIAERAFAAVEAYGFGTRGKPRFKGRNRPLHSLESKTNAAGIRWRGRRLASSGSASLCRRCLPRPARTLGRRRPWHVPPSSAVFSGVSRTANAAGTCNSSRKACRR